MKPTPYQTEFRALPRSVRLLAQPGGKGGGKTSAAFFRMMDLSLDVPRSQILFVRPTERPLVAQFNEYRRFLSEQGVDHRAKENEMRVFVADSCAYFAPAPDVDFVNASLAGSQGYELVVIDEAQTWAQWETWAALLGLNRSTRTQAQAIIIANPGGPCGYQISRLFVQPAKQYERGVPFMVPDLKCNCIVLMSTLDDGVLGDDEAYDASLWAAAGGNRALYERMRYGNFDVLAGAAFEVYEHHRVRWPTIDWLDPQWSHLKPVAAGDHGSRAIFCILGGVLFQRDGLGADGTLYAKNSLVLLDEATSASPESSYVKAAYAAEVADVAESFYKMCERLGWPDTIIPTVYMDSAITAFQGAPSTIFEEYEKYMRVAPATKGRVADGVLQINTLLANAQPPFLQPMQSLLPASFNVTASAATQHHARHLPGLYLDPVRCAYLHFALTNILRDPKNPDSLDPSSKLDHAIDTLRYLANTILGASLTGNQRGLGSSKIWTSEPGRISDAYGHKRHVLDPTPKQKRSAKHQAYREAWLKRNRLCTHPDLTGVPAPPETIGESVPLTRTPFIRRS